MCVSSLAIFVRNSKRQPTNVESWEDMSESQRKKERKNLIIDSVYVGYIISFISVYLSAHLSLVWSQQRLGVFDSLMQTHP